MFSIVVSYLLMLCLLGTLEDTDHVLIDIGTQYFVKQSTSDANAYLKRKTEFVKKQMTELEKGLDEHQRNMNQVNLVMENKANERMKELSKQKKGAAGQ